MQLLNANELENCYAGEDNISKIMFGDELIWENVKLVDLGSAKTFDVKNYTNNWANLTADNFFIIGNSDTAYISGNDSGTDHINYIYDNVVKSYNASTGILTFYVWVYSGYSEITGTANVHAVMVEKKEKLVYLGAGKSFNVKNYDNYERFDYRNFLMLRPNFTNWNSISGVRGPQSFNATAKVNGSYSNGVFSCNIYGVYNHQNTGSGTPRVDSEDMIVYLLPKVLP